MKARITSLLQVANQRDYLPLLILIVAIQGTVLVSQALAALLVPAAHVGQIRTFESVFSVLVLIAGFGAPALAIRELSIPREPGEQAQALRDLALMPLLGTAIVGVGTVIGTVSGLVRLEKPILVIPLIIILLISVSTVRLLAAVSQGLLVVRSVFVRVLIGSVGCAILQTVGALQGRLSGWAEGRIAGELVLLAAILSALRPSFPRMDGLPKFDAVRFRQFGRMALTLNGSLIVRMIADAAPIILLGITIDGLTRANPGAAPELKAQIGYFGMATLVLTLALLPISVVSQQALPVLARTSGVDRNVAEYSFRRRMLGVGVIIAVGLAAACLIVHFLGITNLVRGMLPAATLMLVVPIKASAAALGTILTARGKFDRLAVVNLVELLAIAIIIFSHPTPSLVYTAILSMICGSLVNYCGLAVILNRTVQHD